MNHKITKLFLFFIFFINILIFFLFFDFISSYYLNQSTKNIYLKKKYGFYELKKNLNNYEVFGSHIYKVNTDKNGFRNNGVSSEINSNFIFLGDSATYGMMKWDETYPGIFEYKIKQNIINAGVPSYSPTTYIYSYKKALNKNVLNKNHYVFVGLDISDVQDESGHWRDADEENISEIDHPINLQFFQDQENKRLNNNNNNNNFMIKNFLTSNFKISLIIYRTLRFNLFNKNYLKSIFYTSRSAFTWNDFNKLNQKKATEGDNLTRGYLPLGVEGGIDRLNDKIHDLSKLVKENNGVLYIIIYPWPAQIHFENKFDWEKHIQNLCNDIYCHGVININQIIREYSSKNNNWYKDLYINGDIHLNKHGNKIIAEELLKLF